MSSSRVRNRARRHELNWSAVMDAESLPIYLTADEAANLLRTSRKAVYVMIERRQLPGVSRIGRRVLIRAESLVHWIDQQGAPSLQETQR